ncbi:serine/threonine-protein kinase [Microbacterium trichothecenolyticum]|uniref:serine/threonine-protein kinase n=1 Tax=Microbacterium trichothecenolyticum TaxID=69370 RepID=UPI00285C0C1E|nr:PASTA domain-containing protein [Microbacterium trichothecenolyticum]MDR7182991.1 serine/threonine-protein kinase [Microbacterium trichothecenolyticum]
MSEASGLVSGRFRVAELLGAGGSASVYAAVDVHTGAHVALKILHPHLAQRPVAREAFFAEGRRAQPLRHPNIVGVLGVGVDDAAAADPVAWMALERAAGLSLAQHVARSGPLTPTDALVVADGVLRGLEAVHRNGLIHRDVSPSNIMVAPGSSGVMVVDRVRLLDFGLADAAGRAALGTDDLLSVDARGQLGVMGNVNYMSPEQVRGMPVDERGDLYQVGAVLAFSLTGRPPFPRETTGRTMRAHLDTAPPAPSSSDARIPRALDRIVIRAMLKDPGARFASAAEMRAAVAASAVAIAPAAASTATPPSVSGLPSAATEPADAEHTATRVTGAILAAQLPGSVVATVPSSEHTRVLGRTMVPPRVAGAFTAAGAATGRGPRRARSATGAWLGGAVAAAVLSVVVVLAAMSEPTASVDSQPTTAATPVVSVPAPQPDPEPEPAVQPASTTTVPELARLTLSEATSALAALGLSLGAVTLVDSSFPADLVLESSPAAGRRVADDATIALTVATGANAVPDVAGKLRSDAAAAVQAAGFVPAFSTRPASAGTAPGEILGTTPAPGTRLSVGETVTLLESEPEEPQPTPTANPTAPQPTATPTPPAED